MGSALALTRGMGSLSGQPFTSGLGMQGEVARAVPSGQWDLGQEPGTENQQSPASTSFFSISWLSGSIQKGHQGPFPAQKLLVGTHLCNGPIFQHHDPISLRQDVEGVGHENPCLGRERAEVTLRCSHTFQSWGLGAGSASGPEWGKVVFLCSCTLY